MKSLRRMDYGFVYAAIGEGTIRKASVSASSVMSMETGQMGTFLATSEPGINSLTSMALSYGETFGWDIVMSLDGYGMNFTTLPEIEAFTFADKSLSLTTQGDIASTVAWNRQIHKLRRESKPVIWGAIRNLRSAKIAALILALDVFDVAIIFLDADTLVCDSLKLSSAFDIVSNQGPWFAFVPAPSAHHSLILERMFGVVRGLPPKEPNTGVMIISVCAGAKRVLRRWSEVYWHESLSLGPIQNPMDQPPLRAAIFLENAPWAILHKTFNCRGHVKNFNAAFPMRCGGYDATHWKAITRSTILNAAGATPQLTSGSLASANKILGGRECIVLHSHAIPRFSQYRTVFQGNALITLNNDANKRKVFGVGLETFNRALGDDNEEDTKQEFIYDSDHPFNFSVPKGLIAIFTLSPTAGTLAVGLDTSIDWRKSEWRKEHVIVGSMAKDACATESRLCTVILVLMDPLVRLAADAQFAETGTAQKQLLELAKLWVSQGNTLLDALLPLDARDLDRLDSPRSVRVERYGPGNSAEVEDAVSRLETDAFLVVLAEDPEISTTLLEATLKSHPKALEAAQYALERAVQHNTRGRLVLDGLNRNYRQALRRLLVHDTGIYYAARRLFDIQCDAAQATLDR
eukprot:CAMPEP_0119286294 /NCGR_PEP_ID=MMETSP1329-20130426/33603_1 /TAXON_ID=114041 /ORGANISM="Genus nov. species nov., Strain RCC1024" /LENGTH=632 /DNA_ID=CAMNT_0007287025 /DNA_START=509 /DNA_END=2407 /DNA_ORIENTATION=+